MAEFVQVPLDLFRHDNSSTNFSICTQRKATVFKVFVEDAQLRRRRSHRGLDSVATAALPTPLYIFAYTRAVSCPRTQNSIPTFVKQCRLFSFLSRYCTVASRDVCSLFSLCAVYWIVDRE
jgi:hypothetical protein